MIALEPPRCECTECDCPALPLRAVDPRVPAGYTRCRDCLAGLHVVDRSDQLSRAVEAGRYTAGPVEPGPAMGLEERRRLVAALAEAQALEDDDGLDPPPETVSMPNLADAEEVTVKLSRVEAERLRAAAAERGVTVQDAMRAAVWGWLRTGPAQPPGGLTAADYAAMADSYETDPPRREEMVGEPFIAPSALEPDDED
ncbi:MAG: hypothetical protein FGM52_01625 [Mycobacterium sp.]|nr:hypothetical protein [Mycobacterium sp.]